MPKVKKYAHIYTNTHTLMRMYQGAKKTTEKAPNRLKLEQF